MTRTTKTNAVPKKVPDGHQAVRFLRRYEVQDEHFGTDDATVYDKDDIHVLTEASAAHFTSRGIAEAV